MSSMEETGTGHGIRIKHETGQCQIIEAHYNESGTHRLDLVMDGCNIYLSEEETGYFLAWMTTWYEQGGKALRAEDTARRRSQGARDGWEIRRGKKAGTP
jgi:hypothetical protein